MAIYLMIFKNLQHYNRMTLQRLFLNRQRNIGYLSGVDPGFPVGGASTLHGVTNYDFAKCSKKLHEIEKYFGQYMIRTVSPLYLGDRIHVSKFFTRE